MTRGEALKDFFRKTILPVASAARPRGAWTISQPAQLPSWRRRAPSQSPRRAAAHIST